MTTVAYYQKDDKLSVIADKRAITGIGILDEEVKIVKIANAEIPIEYVIAVAGNTMLKDLILTHTGIIAIISAMSNRESLLDSASSICGYLTASNLKLAYDTSFCEILIVSKEYKVYLTVKYENGEYKIAPFLINNTCYIAGSGREYMRAAIEIYKDLYEDPETVLINALAITAKCDENTSSTFNIITI